MVLDAELQFDVPPTSSQELDFDQYLDFAAGISSLTSQKEKAKTKATFTCDLHVIEDLPCDIILSDEFIFQNQVFSRFKTLFYSKQATTSLGSATILNDDILFLRNTRTSSPWFCFWRRQPQGETNTSKLSLFCNSQRRGLTSLVSLEGGSSREDRWEIEERRRNEETIVCG